MISKTHTLRDEARTLRANSLILRNELKELRRASHDTIYTKSFILRKESQMLRKSDNDKTVEIMV